MLTLYDYMDSGNGYKVRLTLAALDLPYKLIECDILRGETRTPEFLARNPNGRIPTLQLEDGSFLAESGAIIWYLADGTPLAPKDRKARAEALQWMFFEQHAIVPNIGAAYFWLCLVKGGRELQQHALDDWMEEGQRSLNLLDKHMARHRFVAGDRYSVADIALYAYTCVAPHGGIALDAYPALRDWLARVEATPGFVPLPAPDASAQALIDQSI